MSHRDNNERDDWGDYKKDSKKKDKHRNERDWKLDRRKEYQGEKEYDKDDE